MLKEYYIGIITHRNLQAPQQYNQMFFIMPTKPKLLLFKYSATLGAFLKLKVWISMKKKLPKDQMLFIYLESKTYVWSEIAMS